MTRKPSLIEQFDAKCGLYGDFCDRLKILLVQLLREKQLPVHSISNRLKDRESYIRKIAKKDTAYQDIQDVTDVAGIRIVTYFADQVDEVARIIQDEFALDADNSTDKRAALDPDRFGYMSLHYVVSLANTRAMLTEYRACLGLKAEIQIRSILQHAWAEIEHDLGYKTTQAIPRLIRRQFARLSGLLELADSEFVNIRAKLDEYSRDVATRIAEQPNTVGIDKISLIDFAKTDDLVRRLDAAIAGAFRSKLYTDDKATARDVDRLSYLGLSTIADIRVELETHHDNIIGLAEIRARKNDEDPELRKTIPEAVSLFYLGQILAGLTGDEAKATQYFRHFGIGTSPEAVAHELVEFMNSRKTQG